MSSPKKEEDISPLTNEIQTGSYGFDWGFKISNKAVDIVTFVGTLICFVLAIFILCSI